MSTGPRIGRRVVSASTTYHHPDLQGRPDILEPFVGEPVKSLGFLGQDAAEA